MTTPDTLTVVSDYYDYLDTIVSAELAAVGVAYDHGISVEDVKDIVESYRDSTLDGGAV